MPIYTTMGYCLADVSRSGDFIEETEQLKSQLLIIGHKRRCTSGNIIRLYVNKETIPDIVSDDIQDN